MGAGTLGAGVRVTVGNCEAHGAPDLQLATGEALLYGWGRLHSLSCGGLPCLRLVQSA